MRYRWTAYYFLRGPVESKYRDKGAMSGQEISEEQIEREQIFLPSVCNDSKALFSSSQIINMGRIVSNSIRSTLRSEDLHSWLEMIGSVGTIHGWLCVQPYFALVAT